MRKQIAAANWKMNLGYADGEKLIDDLLAAGINLADHQHVVLAVPFPYLTMARDRVAGQKNWGVAAQNCSQHESGAYTGETSVAMLASINVPYCVIGHSERREYFNESNEELARKVDRSLAHGLTPLFCCGEPLDIREAGTQNDYVAKQLSESLFHLSAEQLTQIVIAYEPIWAIGTGKTASTEQAQEMHAHLRSVLAAQYGAEFADKVPILYGGSVKAGNAAELFASPDVDGGLVGGASLVAADFAAIIRALK